MGGELARADIAHQEGGSSEDPGLCCDCKRDWRANGSDMPEAGPVR